MYVHTVVQRDLDVAPQVSILNRNRLVGLLVSMKIMPGVLHLVSNMPRVLSHHLLKRMWKRCRLAILFNLGSCLEFTLS